MIQTSEGNLPQGLDAAIRTGLERGRRTVARRARVRRGAVRSALCLALVLGLAACSVRTPVTAEAFKGAAEELGFTVEDKSSSAAGTQGVRTYYVCTNSGTNQVFYLGFDSKEDSYSFYNTIKEGIAGNDPSVQTVVESDSYCRYVCSVGDTVHTLVRIDNTFVYTTGSSADKAELDDLLKKIGY